MSDTTLNRRVAQIDEEYLLLDSRAPLDEEAMVPTCSLCDAVGHGYPGAGPCPLESPDPSYYADEMRAGR